MSTTKPSNKNLLPALVKSNTLINKPPTNSKAVLINSTFKTPIAINSWKANPIPTIFQSIALRLLLNKNEIKIRATIPKAPLHKLLKEKPLLGIILLASETAN